jgi:CubicO group peptidase (beta-lactamase class C family)
MIIEKITGKKYYDILKKEILGPLKLKNTFPSDHRKLDRLAQGYAVKAMSLEEKIRSWNQMATL